MKNILSYSAVLALLSLAPTLVFLNPNSCFVANCYVLLSVLAGYNCKCQDPSGTGPQWNVETEKVCGYLEGDTGCYSLYHADQHHQVSK
jgi:hypothetical protein